MKKNAVKDKMEHKNKIKNKPGTPIHKQTSKKARKNAGNFTGYPHYTAEEDIFYSDMKRVDTDVENITRAVNAANLDLKEPASRTNESVEGPIAGPELIPGTEADVSQEDMEALGTQELAMD